MVGMRARDVNALVAADREAFSHDQRTRAVSLGDMRCPTSRAYADPRKRDCCLHREAIATYTYALWPANRTHLTSDARGAPWRQWESAGSWLARCWPQRRQGYRAASTFRSPTNCALPGHTGEGNAGAESSR